MVCYYVFCRQIVKASFVAFFPFTAHSYFPLIPGSWFFFLQCLLSMYHLSGAILYIEELHCCCLTLPRWMTTITCSPITKLPIPVENSSTSSTQRVQRIHYGLTRLKTTINISIFLMIYANKREYITLANYEPTSCNSNDTLLVDYHPSWSTLNQYTLSQHQLHLQNNIPCISYMMWHIANRHKEVCIW